MGKLFCGYWVILLQKQCRIIFCWRASLRHGKTGSCQTMRWPARTRCCSAIPATYLVSSNLAMRWPYTEGTGYYTVLIFRRTHCAKYLGRMWVYNVLTSRNLNRFCDVSQSQFQGHFSVAATLIKGFKNFRSVYWVVHSYNIVSKFLCKQGHKFYLMPKMIDFIFC